MLEAFKPVPVRELLTKPWEECWESEFERKFERTEESLLLVLFTDVPLDEMSSQNWHLSER